MAILVLLVLIFILGLLVIIFNEEGQYLKYNEGFEYYVLGFLPQYGSLTKMNHVHEDSVFKGEIPMHSYFCDRQTGEVETKCRNDERSWDKAVHDERAMFRNEGITHAASYSLLTIQLGSTAFYSYCRQVLSSSSGAFPQCNDNLLQLMSVKVEYSSSLAFESSHGQLVVPQDEYLVMYQDPLRSKLAAAY
ncbi:hypothetical protein EV361DRAFT_873096 [Lentinula raphanica]|nr:hypothetical protein EV361DRAFT_873096 [Lentinula raphanica]